MQQMKRAIQLAAVLLIALMAGQPVLAAANCEMDMSGSPASCPMGMSTMGADCPMAHGMSAECLTRCLDCAAATDLALNAVQAKPKMIVAELATSAEIASQIIDPPRTAFRARAAVFSGSPPRYLLNRAFRI